MPGSERPNILLITTDQQRFDTLQCAGNDQIWTPHLNWLCDNGIRFDNAYSDCPVCCPARVTIMCGRHAHHHGEMSNKWVPGAYEPATSLPGLLGAASYETRLIGKNHHGPSSRHLMGFDSQVEIADYFRFYNRYPELGRPRRSGLGNNEHAPGLDTVGEEHSQTRWTVDRTVDFLETRDPSNPFFAWCSFFEPHPPFTPCANHWELYRDAAVPEPWLGDWSQDLDAMPPAWNGVTRELSMTQRLGAEQLRQARRSYYALVTQVDYHLGELFGRMKELGLLHNTLIVFTTDHGEMLGDHRCGGKCVPFEGAAHIPLIVKPPAAPRSPDPRAGTTSDALVCLADLLPTLTGFAGVIPPEDLPLDGIDLFAATVGDEKRDRLYGDCMYLHYLREANWKYCLETLGGNELLFDLAEDPHETRDLAKAATDVARRMREAVDAHLDECGIRDFGAHDPGVARSDVDMPGNVHPGVWSTRKFW